MPEFTPEQQDAAQFRNLDACVVAGPGSGKTTVLVERYRRLIRDRGFKPREILAITFTEKAAANMKAKLLEACRGAEDFGREMEDAWVSTIHGFCARLLRENAIAAGLDPRFRVLDPREGEHLQYECLTEALDEMVARRREESLALIGALHTPAMTGALKDAYDAMRCAGMTVTKARAIPNPAKAPSIFEAAAELHGLQARFPAVRKGNQAEHFDMIAEWIGEVAATSPNDTERLARLAAELKIHLSYVPKPSDAWKQFREVLMPAVRAGLVDEITAPHRALVFDALERFEEIYAERKAAKAALDFNDLERIAIRLLRANADAKDRVRKQFRQIMLDEFQDINEQQQSLIREIRADNAFFAVGDINQSIYGFRHAEPAIFESYRDEVRDAGKHSAQLLDNFRSRPEILSFVEALLNTSEGIDRRDLRGRATFCEKERPSIEIIRAVAEESGDTDDAAIREGKWIAHRVHTLRATLRITGEDGEPRAPEFRDFAVFCRSRDGMLPILEAFRAAGIPHVCGRRESFLESREVLDITALLSAVANPRDSIALAGVMRSPLVGLGDEALLRLRAGVSSVTSGLNQIAYDGSRLNAFDEEDARKIAAFAIALKRWRQEQPVIPLDLLMVRMLNDCGFTWAPGSRAGEDVEAFLGLARRSSELSLAEFLREVESMKKNQNNESDLSDEDQGNRVQVMTAHGAKGLEYPVTFVAAMSKGVQRSSEPINFSPACGLGIKWTTVGKESAYDSWGNANRARIEAREKEETNRLLYVAMTRAKEHMVLSYGYASSRRGDWSKKIDDFFGLKELEPSDQVRRVTGGPGIVATALVTDRDPPPFFAVVAADREAAFAEIYPLAEDRQAETSVSVTALNVFAHCPRKYYIQRYVGWSGARMRKYDPEAFAPDDIAGEEGSAADLGSAVHDLLAGKTGVYSEEARSLAAVFQVSALGKRVAAARRAEREWEFIVDVGGSLVRGSIDLWFEEEDGELHLVDYKTDSLRLDEAEERARYYSPQLALYAYALERAMGRKPKSASLHFLRPDAVKEVSLDDPAEAVSRLRAAQERFEFGLNPGSHCSSCEFYRNSCPAA